MKILNTIKGGNVSPLNLKERTKICHLASGLGLLPLVVKIFHTVSCMQGKGYATARRKTGNEVDYRR